MSYLMAAFLWCILALLVGASGVAMILGGFPAYGLAALAVAAVAGWFSYRLGRDPDTDGGR